MTSFYVMCQQGIPLLSLLYASLIRKRYPFTALLTDRVYLSSHGKAQPRTHALRRISAPQPSRSNHPTTSPLWLLGRCYCRLSVTLQFLIPLHSCKCKSRSHDNIGKYLMTHDSKEKIQESNNKKIKVS